MSQTHISNIVLVGASGNVGSAILTSLLAAKQFNVTVLTRAESEAAIPDTVKVMKGSYDDAAFLQDVFSGADAAIITLGFTAAAVQPVLIEAAVKAGVKWIVPNEFAGDGDNVAMVNAVPVFQPKRDARQLIKKLGANYIAVSSGPWIEFLLQYGLLEIDTKAKKATLYSETGKFNTSTIAQVGRGVAALLSLPMDNASNPRASLSHYANKFVYISSIYVSQSDIFDSVKRVTSTSDADWTIERKSNDNRIEQLTAAFANGDHMAGAYLAMGYYIGAGRGGDVEKKAAEDREVLQLKEENLDAVVKSLVAA